MNGRRYQLGPELCHLLNCEQDTLRVASQYEFEHTIATRLGQAAPRQHLLLVAELVALQLPLLALQVLASMPQGDAFELAFWHGVACQAAGDWHSAKEYLKRAHHLGPEEIAVHSNLAMILSREGNPQAARRWLRAGLQVDGNAVQLWLAVQQLCSVRELLAWAEQLSAWRGANLYAQLTGDVAAALLLYRRVCAGGERSAEFLIEFSGALGQQGCYTELCALAWQLLGQGTLPWQVYEHFSQGFAQLDNQQQSQRCATLAHSARQLSNAI